MGQKSCRNEILFYKAQDLFESYPSLKLEIQESLLEFKAWVPIGFSPSRRKTFPGHTGYTLTNTVQDEIGFLCCEGVLLAVVHLGVQQDPCFLFFRAASQSVSSYVIAWSYSILRKRLYLVLLYFMRFLLSFLQPVQVLLSSSPALQYIDFSPYLVVMNMCRECTLYSHPGC